MQEPTRDTNVLNIIFCLEDYLVSRMVVGVGECLAESDHHMVWFTVGANFGPEVARPR